MREEHIIQDGFARCVKSTNLDFPQKTEGKVRDVYDIGAALLIVATDRQSAFDRLLGHVPFKGQVLTQTSIFWFSQTAHIIKNHMIASPDPNAMVVKKCRVFPLEFIVRGYMTGTTDTSIWVNYNNNVRSYCGHELPEGMSKNQKLPHNIVTPTTKDAVHDRPLSAAEIINEGILTQEQWQFLAQKSLELFHFGQEVASENGLILVDTKYEFGVDDQGEIILIDEIHTPDSSRYWLASGYEERTRQGQEPYMIDKEFLRIWLRDQCDPYHDTVLPEVPQNLIVELSSRYIDLFERITGQKFSYEGYDQDFHNRLTKNISAYLRTNQIR